VELLAVEELQLPMAQQAHLFSSSYPLPSHTNP